MYYLQNQGSAVHFTAVWDGHVKGFLRDSLDRNGTSELTSDPAGGFKLYSRDLAT